MSWSSGNDANNPNTTGDNERSACATVRGGAIHPTVTVRIITSLRVIKKSMKVDDKESIPDGDVNNVGRGAMEG
jgi:hypothetical protein